MNEKSLPKFAASPDRLDRATVEVVRVVNAIAARLGIEYFLCGATALDVMLTGVFGSQPGRATIDVDFAFTVESWDVFDQLKAALVATGEFEASEKIEQRLYSLRHDRRIVDLIPFGGVENPKGTVSWPPNNDASLNVAGFEEALSSAVRVSLADDFSAPVASLAGLTILKLLAWADRKNINNKDAFDILHILGQYAEAGNEERLYTDEAAILELSISILSSRAPGSLEQTAAA